jgi:hypothetical protein
MVLHPHFTHRESTQDIDYLHRAFATEYRTQGFPDAEERLRRCIAETAAKFNLGADWMNDHADVALPMALECVPHSVAYLTKNQQKIMTQSVRPDVRPNFHRVHAAGELGPSDDLQRARARARRRPMAVGDGAQTRALR